MPNRTLLASSLSVIVALAPLTCMARDFKHPEGPFVPVHNCTCRFDGADVPLGQRRCIRTVDGPRTAVCVMEQNVTSWRPSEEACPQALLYTPRGS